jgi:DNA-binding response OmpR family regulator
MEPCKVLIIEDDESARKQLAKLVRKEGFEVTEAEDGAVGFKTFKEMNHDIIITDFSLPKMDGLELIHGVKRHSPEAQIILVTAFGGDDVAIMALRDGVLDYIKKPIDIDALVLALGRAKENVSLRKRTAMFPNLLLAEDESKIRERLARVLEGEGWKVLQASDGEDAVNIFQGEKVDVVLLDIKMPKKDGLTALKEMRSISDDFEAIILTGFGDESTAIQAMRSGAIGFIRKPLDLDHLIVTVEKAIEKLKLNRALKYRNREIELQKQFAAYITRKNELVINAADPLADPTTALAQKLLDVLPVAVFAVDRAFKIHYYNHEMGKAVEHPDQMIDEEFIKQMAKVGAGTLTYDSLTSRINKVFEEQSGKIERMELGKHGYASLIFLKVKKYSDEALVDFVAVAIRGERA